MKIAAFHKHCGDEMHFIKRIEWATEFGLTRLSNYILYNFKDTPEHFYERLRINIDLNERLGTQIFSFPMKYIPVDNKDRKFVGQNWNSRYLRGIQCILNATHGIVSPKRKLFEAAFGKNMEDFKRLMIMPDRYIIYREDHKHNGAADWDRLYDSLSAAQQEEFHNIVFKNIFEHESKSKYAKINLLLSHYSKHYKTSLQSSTLTVKINP